MNEPGFATLCRTGGNHFMLVAISLFTSLFLGCAQPGGIELSGKEQAGDTITNSIGMKLAYIPAGEFTMGSPEGEIPKDGQHADDERQHRVRITHPFYMGVCAVTQGEYEKVMGDNPSFFAASDGGKDMVKGLNTDRFPIENISWDLAQNFCAVLSRKEGKIYRLPTEAEWEYACRAGTTTAFTFGDSLSSEQANFDGSYPYGGAAEGRYLQRTTAVGYCKANAWNLCDMHGNIHQWCQDWYDKDYYSKSPAADPTGPSAGVSRVARGGGWNDFAVDCRSASRLMVMTTDGYDDVGFRVVIEVSSSSR